MYLSSLNYTVTNEGHLIRVTSITSHNSLVLTLFLKNTKILRENLMALVNMF